MKISDIHSAKRYKFKFSSDSSIDSNYSVGGLVRISRTNNAFEYYVESFGQQEILFADKSTANYIDDLLHSEELDIFHCLYIVEGVNTNSIEIQVYVFNSMTEYKTPIVIKMPQALLDKNSVDKLKNMFVWDGLGQPAIFSLCYKDSDKKKSEIRLLSDKCFLYIQNTARGLVSSKIGYARGKADLPVDVYLAPAVEFILETDESAINDEFARDIEQISKAATYFARWEAYNALAQKLLEEETNEFGELSYENVKKITGMSGTRFEFLINEDVTAECIGAELAVINSTEKMSDYRKVQKIRVGQIKDISQNILTTYRDDSVIATPIPNKGILVLSVSGDEAIIRRRNAAKKRMLEGRSPIKSIVRLIEEGVSEYRLDSDWGYSKAVTDELRRNFKRARDLNQRQQEALELAINTPDIALIQGPPGTGKTTVIEAIRERFREIYEAQQKQFEKLDADYITRRPKILISSFQNEAVDNAISKPLPGDLPAYRIGRKTAEQFQKSMESWFGGVISTLQNETDSSYGIAFTEQKRILADDYFAYKNSGEPIDSAISIIRKYLSFPEIKYPKELTATANSIITEYQKRSSLVDDIADPIVSRLKNQRLTLEAFADDGAVNAQRLIAHIKNRNELSILEADIDAITAVASNNDISDEVFNLYIEVVYKLLERFCPEDIKVDLKDKVTIEKCILQLAHVYSNSYLVMADNIDDKKSLVIGEFIDRFEYEYADLVAKYSLTTAATCQTSMQLRGKEDEIYDLVIIDEAARATPLDLFIPMSMGRKIILVGDQNQLPHMLEPDVLKLITQDPKYKDLPGIDISLFERLYKMFSQGTRPKSILLDTQYRMHPDICQFVSEAFYGGTLKSGITAADRVIPNELFNGKALAYTDISITHGKELSGSSKARPVEVRVITDDIQRILTIAPDSTVGVITFYKAQESRLLESIRSVLNEDQLSRIEVGTVDAFQGKEFDFVLLSCVRSNEIRNNEQLSVGFLVKINRICVALSRAKKQLSVYADAETMNQVPCFNKLYEKCKTMGEGYYFEY